MHIASAALLLAAFAAQRTIATGWTDASAYSCPGNTNNHCSPSQHGGYNWAGLKNGNFTSYGSNQFSGFTCSSSFGKRDFVTKRGFQSKCITGSLDEGPAMSGGSFSIDQMQISSSHDTDIECHYGMPDGSTCTETHSCSSSGSIFQNTQCGGAKSVTFKPGKNAPSGCSIGVHSVGFQCSSASTTPSRTSTSTHTHSASTHTKSTYSTTTHSSSSHTKASHSKSSHSSSSRTKASHSRSTSSSSSQSKASHIKSSYSTSSPSTSGTSQWSAPPATFESSSALASSSVSAASSSSRSSTSVPTPSHSSSTSSALTSSASRPTTKSTTSSSVVSAVSSSSPSPYHPNCPDVLPRCLKTWMFITDCVDNSDTNCFCGNEKLIKNVMECLSAWSPSMNVTAAAASYLMGLCADHVPNNPAIITACPSGVTPGPQTTSSGTVSAQATETCTTITYSSKVTVPATYSTGVSSGFTCPGSSMTTTLVTTVTVPKVSLTTSTVTVQGSTSSSVGLGAPTPKSTPATTTPATPETSAASTTASSTVVCSEFSDGQPQCFTSTASSSPSTSPAAPAYTSTSAVAAASTSSTASNSVGTGTGWGSPTSTASTSPIVPATGAGMKLGFSLPGLALAVAAVVSSIF